MRLPPRLIKQGDLKLALIDSQRASINAGKHVKNENDLNQESERSLRNVNDLKG